MAGIPPRGDLVDRLVRHGLGPGEARCYVSMLAARAFKVSEVAAEAGLPRSRAYELIRSLVRLGLCTEVAGGGVARFRAVPPNEAIGRLEAFVAEQDRRRDLALNGLVQALSARSGRASGGGEEPVEMLRRDEQLLSAVVEAVDGASEEVLLAVNTSWEPIDPQRVRDRLAAGVRFRALIDRDFLEHDPQHWLDNLASESDFLEVRVVDRLETLFLLVDQRAIFLNLRVPGAETSLMHPESLVIHHAGLGQTLRRAFERTWRQGSPIERARLGTAVSRSTRTGS